MSFTVDLNSDLGEGADFELEILDLVTSANISCGFHAGDPASVLRSIRDANNRNVSIGAHPSFLDRENFGRCELNLSAAEIFAQVVYQLGAFSALATTAGARMNHVKPHGALYNMAARETELANAIVEALVVIDPYLILFAPPGSALERAAIAAEIGVVREVFADRNYLGDGSLVPRTRPDALLTDSEQAARRVVAMLKDGYVISIDGKQVPVQAETICVHGDTPGAIDFIRNLRVELELQGVNIRSPAGSL
jgi:UPF0271 protein